MARAWFTWQRELVSALTFGIVKRHDCPPPLPFHSNLAIRVTI